MSDPATIFRPEALERHVRGRVETGGVVRLGRPWLSRLFWSALVLFAAGVVALWTTTIHPTARGPALVDGGTGSVRVLLPAATAARLARAEQLSVQIPGSSGRPVPVVVQEVRVVDVQDAQRLGFGSTSQVGVVVTGRLPDRRAAPDRPVHAEGVLVLRPERLVDVLGHQVGAMLGPGSAQP